MTYSSKIFRKFRFCGGMFPLQQHFKYDHETTHNLFTCLYGAICLYSSFRDHRGKNEINRQEEFHLYCCQAGSFIPIASAPIDSNGCFHLSVPLPQEGFYLLGTEQGVMHPLYLKGNETIRLRFRTKGIVLEGEQTPENQVLSQWEQSQL